LNQPYIDIYYIHRLDDVTPIEKTMEALVDLKNQGKIKHIGISECSAAALRRAHAVHPVSCVQVEYSISCRNIEDNGVLATARELGVAVVAYNPLGNGLLSGGIRKREDFTKPGDLRGMIPALREENFEGNMRVVEKMTEIAEAKGVALSQLAIAWLLAQGDDIIPIPGTTNVNHLRKNMESSAVSISAEEDKTLRSLADGIVGGRVQELIGATFRDSAPLE
jgi:aryl-alcohol dehydrogenase-like predicted oxidoreductase